MHHLWTLNFDACSLPNGGVILFWTVISSDAQLLADCSITPCSSISFNSHCAHSADSGMVADELVRPAFRDSHVSC